MIAIPFQVSDTHYSVVLVLQDDNIERIKSCDPAVFESGKVLVEPFKSLKLADVMLAYASKEDTIRLQSVGEDFQAIMKILCRGWSHRPDLGDHDAGEYQKQTHN